MGSGRRDGGLSAAGEEILRAVLPVVLGPLVPTDEAVRRRALDDAIGALDDYLAHLSFPLQRRARGLLAVLHLLPARLLLLGTVRRWRDAPPDRIAGFLRRARHSRVEPLRRVFDFLQAMTTIAWFDLPAAWPEIGYPGPPIARPDPRGSQP